MHRPIHFELQVDDPERTIGFFSDVFGWRSDRWGDMPYWLQSTGEGDGIDGAVGPMQENGQSIVLTMDVEDVDAARQSVIDAGGAITAERMAIPGIGWIVMGVDPNGIHFGMLQPDPSVSA